MSNQGKRDREGNLGQTGRESDRPAGTSGRDNRGNENWQHGDKAPNEPPTRPKTGYEDDEDSPLGNRTGFR